MSQNIILCQMFGYVSFKTGRRNGFSYLIMFIFLSPGDVWRRYQTDDAVPNDLSKLKKHGILIDFGNVLMMAEDGNASICHGNLHVAWTADAPDNWWVQNKFSPAAILLHGIGTSTHVMALNIKWQYFSDNRYFTVKVGRSHNTCSLKPFVFIFRSPII